MPDHNRPPTVAVVTLGCGRKEVDSENVAGCCRPPGSAWSPIRRAPTR